MKATDPWTNALVALGLPSSIENGGGVKEASAAELFSMAGTPTFAGDGDPFGSLLEHIRVELSMQHQALSADAGLLPNVVDAMNFTLDRLHALVELHARIVSQIRTQGRAEPATTAAAPASKTRPRRAAKRALPPERKAGELVQPAPRDPTPPAPESQVRATRQVRHG